MIHKQAYGFHIGAPSQKHPRLEIAERVASQSSEYERDKRGQEGPLVEDLIYGLN